MTHDPLKGVPPRGAHTSFSDFAEEVDASQTDLAVAARQARVARMEREAFSQRDRARCAVPKSDEVPIHSEIAPKWLQEHRALNRRERRQGLRASRIATDHTLPMLEAMRRQRIVDHEARYQTQWDYHPPRAPREDADKPLVAFTEQQTRIPRIAIQSEANCRMVVAGFPVEVQKRFHALAAWLDGDREYNNCSGAWASQMMRKCVAVWAAIAYGCRVSYRDDYAYVTRGLARKGIIDLVGPRPETGTKFSLGAMSDVDTGALRMLVDFDLLVRTQVPGHVAPASDRDPVSGYAMNHYLFDHTLMPGDDRWREAKGRINPSAPRELLEMTCPALALTVRQRARLDAAHEKKRNEVLAKSAQRDAQSGEAQERPPEGEGPPEGRAFARVPLRARPPPD